MLSAIARLFLLRRLFGRRPPQRRYGYGYGRPRPRPRSGFRMTGPFPTYSRQTRRGTRVSVGGCCLPIPFGLVVVLTALSARLVRASKGERPRFRGLS